MPLSPKDIRHVAHLAHIELLPEEEEKHEKELSAILEFVEKLNEVDTTNVIPLSGGTILENVMRPDEEINKSLEGKTQELLNEAPERKEGWVKVKRVFS